MASKSMIITVPVVLLLLDYWPLRRFEGIGTGAAGKVDRSRAGMLVLEKVPFFVVSLVFAFITFFAQDKYGMVKASDSYPLSSRISNAIVSYPSYVFKIFFPVRLAAFYPHPEGDVNILILAVSAVFLLAVTVYVIKSMRTRPWLFTGWFWFLIMLLPVIGIVQIGLQGMADRYTYGPMIGILIMFVWQGGEVVRRLSLGRAVPIFLVLGVVVMLSFLTNLQIVTWANDEALFSHAAEVTKDNYWAHNNLGVEFAEQGRYDEALGHYRRALEIEPDNPKVYSNLGTAMYHLGDNSKAIYYYEKSLASQPGNVVAYNNLGQVYFSTGQVDRAIECYLSALKTDPDFAEAYTNLGIAYASKGMAEQAMAQFARAVELNPSAAGYNNLAKSLLGLGRVDEAERYFLRALELEPGNADINFNLGVLFAGRGELVKAAGCMERVLKVNPSHPQAAAMLSDLQRQLKGE